MAEERFSWLQSAYARERALGDISRRMETLRAELDRGSSANLMLQGVMWATIMGGFVALYFKG